MFWHVPSLFRAFAHLPLGQFRLQHGLWLNVCWWTCPECLLRVHLVAEPLALDRAPPSHSHHHLRVSCLPHGRLATAARSVGQSGIMTVSLILKPAVGPVACMCVYIVGSPVSVVVPLRFVEGLAVPGFFTACLAPWRGAASWRGAQSSPKLC